MKKTIIIGASQGIGKALITEMIQDSHTIGLLSRNKEKLEKIYQQHEAVQLYRSHDITQKETAAVLEEMTSTLGGLDVLVLTAGTGFLNKELDYDLESTTNELNVVAFTKVVNWGYHFFEKQGHGHLVFITSIAGLRGGKVSPSYNASKAYQINYLEGLSQKNNNPDIHITDIRPGFVDTAMAKGNHLFWVASPEKAAKQIYRILKSQKSVAYVTKRWKWIALILKLLPRRFYRLL